MTFQPSNTLGSFLPINETFIDDPEQFLIQLTKIYSDIARFQNLREIALYDLVELGTGQQWFNPTNAQSKRFGFREVFQLPATAAGATTTITHGISGITIFTAIYGTAITNVVDYRPIPYASATAVNQQIELKVSSTTITIINGAAAPNITNGVIILEYLKN